jgi:hypothetical protein
MIGGLMKRIILIGTVIALSVLSGCASINTPSSSLIDEIPVFMIGSTETLPEDYIILIPANVEFPVDISITGNAFAKTASTNQMMSMKNNLYLYQYWASHDGKSWVQAHELFNLEVSGGLAITGGLAELKLDNAE